VIHNIRQALAGDNARLRADSSELLVHRSPADIGQALTTMLTPGDDEWRLARTALALSVPVTRASHLERLRQLLSDESEAVRSIAAFHVRELGLQQEQEAEAARSAAPVSAPNFGQELLTMANRLLETPLAPTPRLRRS
jgi:HEAT repeat protein